MKRILLAAALIAASSIPALATDWWTGIPKVVGQYPFTCAPASQGYFPSPLAAMQGFGGTPKVTTLFGAIEICGEGGGCVDFFRSEAECEKVSALVDKVVGALQ